MLPTTLLCHCGLCLLHQARSCPLAFTYAKSTPIATFPGQLSFIFTSLMQVYSNEANVKQVDVSTQSGAFGILEAHVPTLQALRPGVVTVHTKDGTTTKYFVSSGSVIVNANSSVQLLAEEAMALYMLDLAATRSSLEKVHSDLLGESDEAARAEVQIQLEVSEAVLKAL